MTDQPRRARMRSAAAIAALSIGLGAGGYGIASATSGSSAASATATTQTTAATRDNDNDGHRGGGGGHAGETALTGEALTKVTAAATAKVPGGTIERVETDSDGNAKYEAHMTKADGSDVTVYVDASYNVVSVESR